MEWNDAKVSKRLAVVFEIIHPPAGLDDVK